MAHLVTDPSIQQRWICIYPQYINSQRTQEEGRRVPLASCCDNPKVTEMRDVLQFHGFQCIIEDKQYPRDSSKDALCRGRVRIQLKQSDGSPCNPQFTTRIAVMKLLGEMIPKLKGRSSATQQAAGGQQQASSNKGKNKKKK